MCWDNVWVELFNATLKNERVYQMVYPTRAKAIRYIASWVELEHTITNDFTHPWGTSTLERGREGMPPRKTSSLKPAFHSCPQNTKQSTKRFGVRGVSRTGGVFLPVSR